MGNKKYYYLKLKENFFESEEMVLLQQMKDGYLYSDILLKMYLRSLKGEGQLMYKNCIRRWRLHSSSGNRKYAWRREGSGQRLRRYGSG